MKNRLKRTLTLIFSTLMLLSIVSFFTPLAAVNTEQIEYEISDGEVTVTGYTGNASELSIPETIENLPVTKIEESAFYDCTSLKSINIPKSVTSIGKHAFSCCPNITKITVDSKNPVYDSRDNSNAIIETATNTLIKGCNNTTIPKSVERLESRAYYGCNTMISVNIPEGVKSIGEWVFDGCQALTEITVDSKNPVFDSRDNSNAIIETHTNTLIRGCAASTIPESVTAIGSYAFNDSGNLRTITIHKNVSRIGTAVFGGCTSLYKIEVDAENPYFDSRDNSNAIIETATDTLIQGCAYTVIPDSVKAISDYAFYYMPISSVYIGKNLTKIGTGAFYGCNSLTDVMYGGSNAQWDRIDIGKYNDNLDNATIHLGSEAPTASVPTEAPTEKNAETEQKSESEESSKDSGAIKRLVIGFSLIALIVLVVIIMWVIIIKKVRKA